MVPTELSPGFVEERSPIVIAHRGASLQYPENTLEAFEAAISAGADMIELDARLSADGVLVVSHDADLSHTTDGAGFVADLTVAELKRLNAAAGPRSRRAPVGAGARAEIPTLREALDLLSGRAGVDIEIKNIPGEPDFDTPAEAVAEHLAVLLGRSGFDGDVLVTSFNWFSIERVRERIPSVRTGLLTTPDVDPRDALTYASGGGHACVLPEVRALLAAGEGFVREVHDRGLRVGTWTVDEPETVRRVFALGADAVATNDPAMAVAARDAPGGAED